MSKAVKQMQMEHLKNSFNGVRDLVLLHVAGLDAINENKARLALRKKGIRLQMVKNTLARRVFGDLGLKVDAKQWHTSTTLAWGGTSIAELSKEIDKFSKQFEKFVKVKTAVADGQEVSFETAKKMPTREGAIGRVLMLAMSPAGRLASQILGPAGKVAGQVKSLKDAKKDEPAPAA